MLCLVDRWNIFTTGHTNSHLMLKDQPQDLVGTIAAEADYMVAESIVTEHETYVQNRSGIIQEVL